MILVGSFQLSCSGILWLFSPGAAVDPKAPPCPFGISRVALPLAGEGIPTPACLGQDQEGFFMAQSQVWDLLKSLCSQLWVLQQGFCQGFLGSYSVTPSEQAQSG